MKTKMYLLFILAPFLFTFSSCDEEVVPGAQVVTETDFNNGADGWTAVYAEYPWHDSAFYEMESGIRSLPSPLDQAKKGFMLSGNNHSDALQMFLSKKLSGLAPNTSYKIETEVELASMYPDGSVGIGGSPGNAVHLVSKFATKGYTLDKGTDEWDNVQLVLNKEGTVMEMDLGDVSIPSEEYIYQLITRKKSSGSQVVKSDQDGKLWAVVGTWSGFEGITVLYYTKIKITLTRM
ncbi:MAG TPA: hypothetical protein VFG54_22165 [Prolixibacteraceae bacterium]|nr:hypothetical protein [Prolixibacteraceae bacterium]